MRSSRNSPEEARRLGSQLRSKRKSRGFTLKEVAEKTTINVGQLSRFEHGDFVFMSSNLQILSDFLQKQDKPTGQQPKLVARFAAVLAKSDRHKAAAGAMVSALEMLE